VLEGSPPQWSDIATVNVVLAARGYPTSPEKGAVIKGLGNVPEDVIVFHAGTKREEGKLLVNGGRVLSLVGTGPSIGVAREAAYEGADRVAWPGVEFRTDIAG
jgi:phosphoribosylamine--glycine ligase